MRDHTAVALKGADGKPLEPRGLSSHPMQKIMGGGATFAPAQEISDSSDTATDEDEVAPLAMKACGSWTSWQQRIAEMWPRTRIKATGMNKQVSRSSGHRRDSLVIYPPCLIYPLPIESAHLWRSTHQNGYALQPQWGRRVRNRPDIAPASVYRSEV